LECGTTAVIVYLRNIIKVDHTGQYTTLLSSSQNVGKGYCSKLVLLLSLHQ
jgi:hypothetical protein